MNECDVEQQVSGNDSSITSDQATNDHSNNFLDDIQNIRNTEGPVKRKTEKDRLMFNKIN